MGDDFGGEVEVGWSVILFAGGVVMIFDEVVGGV